MHPGISNGKATCELTWHSIYLTGCGMECKPAPDLHWTSLSFHPSIKTSYLHSFASIPLQYRKRWYSFDWGKKISWKRMRFGTPMKSKDVFLSQKWHYRLIKNKSNTKRMWVNIMEKLNVSIHVTLNHQTAGVHHINPPTLVYLRLAVTWSKHALQLCNIYTYQCEQYSLTASGLFDSSWERTTQGCKITSYCTQCWKRKKREKGCFLLQIDMLAK